MLETLLGQSAPLGAERAARATAADFEVDARASDAMNYAAMEAWTGSGGAGHPGHAAAVAVSAVLKLVCVAR
jgi:hypothetical protein